MLRTQIQLTEEQSSQLKRISLQQGVSVAELIRKGIDTYLRAHNTVSSEKRKERACAAAGRFRSGCSDLSTEHDKYLAEALDR